MHVLQHQANPTGAFVLTAFTAAVRGLAQARHGRERTVENADDTRETDVLRTSAQQIAAATTFATIQNPVLLQLA